VVGRGLRDHRRGDGALRGDDELDGHLSGQLRIPGELALVAVADLTAVAVDDLADEFLVDRAHHHRIRGGDADVHALLAAHPQAHALAVLAHAAAAPLGADPADADGVTDPAAAGARTAQP